MILRGSFLDGPVHLPMFNAQHPGCLNRPFGRVNFLVDEDVARHVADALEHGSLHGHSRILSGHFSPLRTLRKSKSRQVDGFHQGADAPRPLSTHSPAGSPAHQLTRGQCRRLKPLTVQLRKKNSEGSRIRPLTFFRIDATGFSLSRDDALFETEGKDFLNKLGSCVIY